MIDHFGINDDVNDGRVDDDGVDDDCVDDDGVDDNGVDDDDGVCLLENI